ncbi:MAG: Fe-Mn family superoxide dismutase [Chlamydiales bacterium]|jgi:Fe-Mn family superoxide dismutase
MAQKHELPDLPFSAKDLAPFISEETFEYHWGKHHRAYVTNLNKLVDGTEFADETLEDIIRKSKGGVFNNAAQHWNHSFFWNCLSPNGGGIPKGDVLNKINESFGDVETFKEQFSQAAATLFGAGWAWLAQNDEGKLEILPLSNAETPITHGKKPILTLDVWEHAYYIDYRNARPKFIEGWWDVVNWEFAEQNMKAEKKFAVN